jgi:dienelactone hydrolase
LVLHGADDPYVPDPEVQGFVAEMKSVPNIDWQLVSFGGAVHSFTDVDAKAKGQAMYDAKTAARAYRLMRSFFSEAFAAP